MKSSSNQKRIHVYLANILKFSEKSSKKKMIFLLQSTNVVQFKKNVFLLFIGNFQIVFYEDKNAFDLNLVRITKPQ